MTDAEIGLLFLGFLAFAGALITYVFDRAFKGKR